MPTSYGKFMAGNPAIAIALRPRTNFAQARLDRQNALIYEQQVTNMLQTRAANKQNREKEISAQFQAIASLGLLPQDQQRAVTFNERARADLYKRIRDYGGDALRFLEVEGGQWVDNFKINMTNDPTLKRAIMNKTNKGLADKDLQDGMELRPVQWNTLENGKEVVKTGSFEENLMDFVANKTSELNYSGGFKFDVAKIKEFANTHADPTGLNNQYMSKEDVLAWATQEGIPQPDAQYWVDKHYDKVRDGLQWNNIDVQYRNALLDLKKKQEAEEERHNRAAEALKRRGQDLSNKPQQAPLNVLNPTTSAGRPGVVMAITPTATPHMSDYTPVQYTPYQTSVAAKTALGRLLGIVSTPTVVEEVTGGTSENNTRKKTTKVVDVWTPDQRPVFLRKSGENYMTPVYADNFNDDRVRPYLQVANGKQGIPIQSMLILKDIKGGTYAALKTLDGSEFIVPYNPNDEQSAASQYGVLSPSKTQAMNQLEISKEEGIIIDRLD